MARRRRAQRILSSDDESQPSPNGDPPSSSSEEEDDDDGNGNPFVDLEAADEDASASSDGEDSDGPGSTFHHFSQLPPELRDKVWEFFCPDLTASARVLRLGLELDYDDDEHEATGHFWEGTHLEAMTETFRCLSSVHRESRQRALRFAPDEIILGGYSPDAVVRINGSRDILCLDYVHYSPRIEHSSQWQPECGGPVQNIAIGSKDFEGMREFWGFKPFESLFPELKAVYNKSEEISLNDRWLRWCATDYAHKYYHERLEDVEPVPQILPMLVCFPNVERYPDFAKYSLGGLARNRCDEAIVDEIEGSGFALWPMVSFPYMAGLERFEDLEKTKHAPLPELPPDWPSDAEEEALVADAELEDDYESDGINDEEISEDDLSSEDELIPRAISPGSDEEAPISIDSSSDDEAPAANFSSMEPSEDEAEAVATTTTAATKRKRRVVSDSDDDEDEAGNNSEERSAPGQKKRRRVVRTLQSDSETETGDVDPPTRKAASSDSEDEDGLSESSSSDEKEPAPRPMSLAQRLRQQPTGRQVRTKDSDNENENDDDDRSSADDEDEDEGARPRRGGAFFLDEASEEDGDEDEDEDEDEYDSELN